MTVKEAWDIISDYLAGVNFPRNVIFEAFDRAKRYEKTGR